MGTPEEASQKDSCRINLLSGLTMAKSRLHTVSYPALAVEQCIILVGGLGTRLKARVCETPKPMLEIGGKPFLTHVIREFARHGFTRFLLLAGYRADVVREYFSRPDADVPSGISITVVEESEPLGTGGALRAASAYLEEEFFLCNGDSLCLFNFLRMAGPLESPENLARMALMSVERNTRYGQVVVDGNLVAGFTERSASAGPGLMNAGIYYMRRELLNTVPPGKSSLEGDVFPLLAARGVLEAEQVFPHFFIDIGIPEDLERAQTVVPHALRRPAVFFDRDGVLNHDFGHVHDVSDFQWIDGAWESILACNEAGYYVFVVTNQAGIAKGLYPEAAMHELHAYMRAELRKTGAHVDAFAFCPHHPDGVVPALRKSCSCRKPEPGMLLRLSEDWAIASETSFLIGDKPSDVQAAEAAGIPGVLFSGGNLLETLLPRLRVQA